jgi:DNA-binding NtrC family response regulator
MDCKFICQPFVELFAHAVEWGDREIFRRQFSYTQKKPDLLERNLMEMIFELLIADRNPHIRDFLKRELTAEGYHVYLAKTSRELLETIACINTLDLLILDPDLPDQNDPDILMKIQSLSPGIPIVIHSHQPAPNERADRCGHVGFVEKKGNSIDQLKQTIFSIVKTERTQE